MTPSKLLTFFIILFTAIVSANAGLTFNQNGDFTVELITDQSVKTTNDNIQAKYVFEITNNLNSNQDVSISPEEISGWDVLQNPGTLSLDSKESKQVELIYRANSDFDYKTDLVSSDTVKISLDESYGGNFEFPLTLSSQNDKANVVFKVEVIPAKEVDERFSIRFASNKLNPEYPLKYAISADEIVKPTTLEIRVFQNEVMLGNFEATFTPEENYQIFQNQITAQVDPKDYTYKVSARLKREDNSYVEWVEEQVIPVTVYNPEFEKIEDISIGLFTNKVSFNVTNLGNTKDSFEVEVFVPFWKSLFFTSNVDYEIENNKALLQLDLEKGENGFLLYKFNYISLVVLLIILIVVVIYIALRKLSNPLAIETKLYDIKKSKHEGVKSMKVRIGFENIKSEEIENLKIIFRMPTYLTVKENSFLLTSPKQVLKGAAQYKLVWEFKRFEKSDSRILGFTMVNARGILGDVRLEDLEMEVKVNGKVRKYYKTFPVIKG